MTDLGRAKAAEFPHMRGKIEAALGRGFPLHYLGVLAGYGLYAGVSTEGVDAKSMLPKVQQHHVELLQAIILGLPESKWGREPAKPDDMQLVIDTLADLADAFHQRRYALIDEDADTEDRALRLLREMIQSHTQIVRNWGYFSHVRVISRGLYGPLGEDLRATTGFTTDELLNVADWLADAIQKRVNDDYAKMRKVFRGRTGPQVIRRYAAQFPDEIPGPDSLVIATPPDATVDGVKARLLDHAGVRLTTLFGVSAEEVAAGTDIDVDVADKILRSLSLSPGALENANPEFSFLDNPVWAKPGIHESDLFYFAMPQAVFSHIHDVMRALFTAAGLETKLAERRAAYLEDRVEALLRQALPKAQINRGYSWTLRGERFENDVVAVLDRTIVIVEAKSVALTGPGLRGAEKRLRRHIQDLVIDPSVQSSRLQSVIRQLGSGEAVLDLTLPSLGIDFEKVRNVVRISVTLDDFSVLSSSEVTMREAALLPDGLQLAPTLNVADLMVAVEILDRPATFIHYFLERERFQKVADIFGDELDFLGFYLSTGFNVAGMEASGSRIVLTGMSAPLDQFYSSADAGVRLKRPVLRLRPYISRLLCGLEDRSAERWLDVSVDLLRCGDFQEQKQIENRLEDLRRSVLRNWRTPNHLCCVLIKPPDIRDTAFAFYLYPEQLKDKRRDTASYVAADALEQTGRERCVLIGRNVNDWTKPYSFWAVVEGEVSLSEAT